MSSISKAYLERYNEIQDMVDKAIKDDGREIWLKYSAYEWSDDDMPINNLKEIPIKGKVVLLSEEGDFRSEVLESPTWLEIAVVTNKMCIETECKYNVFLEELSVYENNGISEATIIMGENL